MAKPSFENRILAAALASVGFAGCTKKPAPTPAPSLPAEALFALEATAVAAAEAPATPPSWSVAARCSLVYQIDISATQDTDYVADGGVKSRPFPRSEVHEEGRFTVRGGDHGELRLEYGPFYGSLVRSGDRNPKSEIPPGPPPTLESSNHGRALAKSAQTKGTSAWDQLGTAPGLWRFFPQLPEDAKPGSQIIWKPAEAESGAAGGLEAAPIRVTYEGWFDLHGQPAALLRARFPFDADAGFAEKSIDAAYIITGSGHLIWSRIVEHASDQKKTPPVTMKQDTDVVSELRLASGCTEPPLRPFEHAPNPRELFLNSYSYLVEALRRGDFSQAGQTLAIQSAAHNSDIAALKEYVRRYGVASLGDPHLAEGVSEDGEHLKTEFTGYYKTDRGESVSTRATVLGISKAGTTSITSVSVADVLENALLVISDGRVVFPSH